MDYRLLWLDNVDGFVDEYVKAVFRKPVIVVVASWLKCEDGQLLLAVLGASGLFGKSVERGEHSAKSYNMVTGADVDSVGKCRPVILCLDVGNGRIVGARHGCDRCPRFADKMKCGVDAEIRLAKFFADSARNESAVVDAECGRFTLAVPHESRRDFLGIGVVERIGCKHFDYLRSAKTEKENRRLVGMPHLG